MTLKKVDSERSEHGQQRRTTSGGRLIHACCMCDATGPWDSKTWSAYYSIKELDEGELFPKFCSDECRKKGGAKAKNVTQEMLEAAKAREMREPNIVYREATDKEKYAHAVSLQKSTRNPAHD